MLFSELLRYVPHTSSVDTGVTISGITIDSREAGPGVLFVARRGSSSDGHAFIDDAIRRGCTAVLCESAPELLLEAENLSFAVVDNAHIAVAQAAHALYDFPARSMRIIGVTGTNGKTSCTTILKQLLEAHGQAVGMIGTVGNFIGNEFIPSAFTTPEAPELCALLQRMKSAGVDTVVMEVSSHSLALERVHGIDFAAALFTNLTQDHLDFHGTMDAYALAKKKLFDGLTNTAVACVWSDDPYAQLMVSDCSAHVHSVGTQVMQAVQIVNGEAAKLSAPTTSSSTSSTASSSETPSLSTWAPRAASRTHHHVQVQYITARGIEYTLDTATLRAPLFGEFHVANTALAWQCLAALGFDASMTTDALSRVHGAAGRMQVVELGGFNGIVDYAHTPDALEKTLQSVRMVIEPGQRILCVVGCGGDRDKTKRPLMGAIACRLSDTVWFTSDNPRTEDPVSIIEDMLRGVESLEPRHRNAPVHVDADRRRAIQSAVSQAEPGDLILVAGKGHEDYQILGTTKHPFSDVEELRAAAGV
ncbi:MAG: UDP-N-acetylmuramoyl-L-alanyl-D-glutamate--2,6-diaminopimelate ligase [Candidatus Kapaibacterium sp.]|jgi:UDP-N-acetylmuramoyl-L-alanyl-D-glutamate--2,6-diaminopimelate ligase